tara:strand:+ start:558 stop:1184 length:627 start_codon:yes stop_codon:yes gene_type:complete
MVTPTANIEKVEEAFPYLKGMFKKERLEVKEIIKHVRKQDGLRLLQVYPELEYLEAYRHTVALIAITYAKSTATQLLLTHYQTNYHHNYFNLLQKYLTNKHCLTIHDHVDDLKEIIDEGALSGYRLLSLKLCYTALQIIKGDDTTYNIKELVEECNKPRAFFKHSPTRLILKHHNNLAKGNIINISKLSEVFYENLYYNIVHLDNIAA